MREEGFRKAGKRTTGRAKPLQVLIVEDSEDDALLMVHQLRKGRDELDFRRVETPQAMRDALRKPWDMVISDHCMPGFSAPDALRILNENKPGIPFIIVSGHLEAEMVAEVTKSGARCCINKDDMALLLPVVEREIRETEKHNRKSRMLSSAIDEVNMFKQIVDHSTDVIWISDLQLDLKYVSNAVFDLSGYTAADVLIRNFNGLLSDRSLAALRKNVERDLTVSSRPGSLRPRLKTELEIIKKDGSSAFAETSLALFRDGRSGRQMLVGAMRDVSDRKYSEACQHDVEVKKLSGHLMRSMWQMAGAIAHEINNPLSVVSGYAQTLLKKELSTELSCDIKGIYDASQRIAGIVTKMLQFTARDNVAYVELSVNRILEVSLDLCLHDLRQDDIAITVQLESSLPNTSGNSAQLQQVFVHLITNARIEMKQAHGKGKLYIQTRTLEDTVSITIQDDGPGIAQENLERIFEPFFTTREVGKGQGLGLSLCYAIVDAHGGDMYAMSRPGGEAAFVVNLPAYKKAEASE
ncbi:MAG: hybrid sensor histidine kinase/response regulator [Dehalococcoidia bacterium]|nr:MAG: hybrid sensor histidine kinase/response regulator [Dehalococcoidia bacterium]